MAANTNVQWTWLRTETHSGHKDVLCHRTACAILYGAWRLDLGRHREISQNANARAAFLKHRHPESLV
eukprot:899580-Amphidinium_carterae.1